MVDRTHRSEVAKRVFDVAVSSFMLIAGMPVLLAIGLLVAVTSRGGVLFAHERVGRGGRRFRCLKFRTMFRDADARLERVLAEDPELAAEWQRTFKLKDDPRMTRVGRVLRRTSLDELPQFFNVLRGDMSVVGPRPVVPEELDRYGEHATTYLSVLPGMTGLWQVNGRSDTSYEHRVELDVRYATTGTLLMDATVVLRTIGVVLQRSAGGAY